MLAMYLNGLLGHSSTLKIFPDTCKIGKYFLFLSVKNRNFTNWTDNFTDIRIFILTHLNVIFTRVSECPRKWD